LKGKYLEEYMVLNMKTGNGKVGTNRELEEMIKGENTVKWIKGQRMNWLGHLERIEEDRVPKKIFTQELEGTRRRGRPRKRWKGKVERELRVLGVRRWRELVADGTKWKDIVRQAKAHSGLWCQWKKGWWWWWWWWFLAPQYFYVQYIRTDLVNIHEYCGGLDRIVHRAHLTTGRSLTTPGLIITLQKLLSRNRLYVLGREWCAVSDFFVIR